MNITVIGATGMVGSRVAREADRRGHRLTTTSRRSLPGPGLPPTTMHVTLDAQDRRAVRRALHAADLAVMSVRPPAGHEASLATMTGAILDAAASTGTRLLVVGGAGPLRSPRDPRLLVRDDPSYVPAQYRPIAAASSAQLDACFAHPHTAWAYLSPPALLEPGERTGAYRRGTTTLLVDADGTSRISAEDLAVAVLDEVERPGTDRHFTVARIEHGPEPT
jgi:putative NADH-flavin reductase